MPAISPIEATPRASGPISSPTLSVNTARPPVERSQPELALWLLVLSVLPFLAIPAAHLLSSPHTATGLFHYELPYYVANGRAALERGNGWLYPNPYDPSNSAPAIYVHWLPAALGVATTGFGFDPGYVILCLTLAAAIAFAAATRRLVSVCVPRQNSESDLLFLWVMWGGGLLVIGSLLAGRLTGREHINLLDLDPGNGMWFLSWGRNALFPTEAVYHTIVACCWVAEIKQRRVAANIWMLLLATTHPWSGLELILTLNVWRTLRWIVTRHRREAGQLAFSALTLAAFLTYYKVWLPSFEPHAALQRVWELDWSLKWSSAAGAWGVVAVLAGVRLISDRSAWRNETVQFLICALVVAGGLSLHDRVMKPVQPLHFTRGYVWMPLCLLGAPVILTLFTRSWRRSWTAKLAVCGVCLILVSDNLVFAAIHTWRQYQREDGFHLQAHDRALLDHLHGHYPEAVVLTESSSLNYLMPAYANLRPWLGHQFNTPQYPERRLVMQRCFASASVRVSAIPSDVDLMVIKSTREAHALVNSGEWMDCRIRNSGWSAWLRAPAKAK